MELIGSGMPSIHSVLRLRDGEQIGIGKSGTAMGAVPQRFPVR